MSYYALEGLVAQVRSLPGGDAELGLPRAAISPTAAPDVTAALAPAELRARLGAWLTALGGAPRERAARGARARDRGLGPGRHLRHLRRRAARRGHRAASRSGSARRRRRRGGAHRRRRGEPGHRRGGRAGLADRAPLRRASCACGCAAPRPRSPSAGGRSSTSRRRWPKRGVDGVEPAALGPRRGGSPALSIVAALRALGAYIDHRLWLGSASVLLLAVIAVAGMVSLRQGAAAHRARARGSPGDAAGGRAVDATRRRAARGGARRRRHARPRRHRDGDRRRGARAAPTSAATSSPSRCSSGSSAPSPGSWRRCAAWRRCCATTACRRRRRWRCRSPGSTSPSAPASSASW